MDGTARSSPAGKKRHRGRHPADETLFAPARLPALRTAVNELSWLLERGYSESSSLALVGDRHELRKRQRKAVLHCACSDRARIGRTARKLSWSELAGRHLAIDGFNCIITLETAMSGGVVLVGRDGAYRDLSSVHGNYRRVEETHSAVTAVANLLAGCGVASVHWLLDRPVSNSGRLKALIEQVAPSGIPWQVELDYNPDRVLSEATDRVTATSDAWILDRCGPWIDLPAAVVGDHPIDQTWILDLGVLHG
ncbi:MAG: DUF434 domain-containing protein [Proteobacteria bacterium]|nr:DUF434 domain-containing protein [Pseudomonadota bacterium]